jgi:hypothetical protein
MPTGATSLTFLSAMKGALLVSHGSYIRGAEAPLDTCLPSMTTIRTQKSTLLFSWYNAHVLEDMSFGGETRADQIKNLIQSAVVTRAPLESLDATD